MTRSIGVGLPQVMTLTLTFVCLLMSCSSSSSHSSSPDTPRDSSSSGNLGDAQEPSREQVRSTTTSDDPGNFANSVTDVRISSALTPGYCSLTADRFLELLRAAESLAENDERVRGWSFSPFCSGTFNTGGEIVTFQLFLGGLMSFEAPNGGRRYLLLNLTEEP